MTAKPDPPSANIPSAPFSLRPARLEEDARVHAMVRAERLNPISINWHRFIVAVDTDGSVIGCAQMKPHSDGSRELSSLIVMPGWRGRGVARALIEYLLEEYPGTIFLTCRSTLEPLYQRFGFQSMSSLAEMPTYFRRIMRVFQVIRTLRLTHERLLVMRLVRPDQD